MEDFRALADLAPVLIRICDAAQAAIDFNRLWFDITGLPADRLLGEQWLDLVHPDDRPMLGRARGERLLDRTAYSTEFRLRRRDGGYLWVRDTVAARGDGEGRCLGFVGCSVDISDRKRAEQQLHSSEHRFARFMRHLPGLAWIKDDHGRYVYANDAAVEAFHTPRERLYGASDAEVFPAETAAEFTANDQRALASESGVQVVESLDHEDGVRHDSVVSKFPIAGPQGEIAHIGGIAIDITDRRRAVRIIREQSRILEMIARGAPLETCLNALCLAVERVNPRARAAVLLSDGPGDVVRVIAPQIPTFAEALARERSSGRGAQSLFFPESGVCSDVADSPCSEAWRDFCRAEQIRAWCSAPIVEPGLSPHGVVVLCFDSTEAAEESEQEHAEISATLAGIALRRDQSDAALRETERRYRHTVDSSPIAVYTTDASGCITLFNPAAAELWGRTPQLGEPWWGGCRIYRNDGSPLPIEDCPMAITLREGRAIRGEEIQIERADGARVNVLVHPEPLFDANGVLSGAVNMLVDITGRKQAEEALGRSEARYRAIVEGQAEMICRFRIDGTILFANGAYARACGTTPEQLVGESFWNHIPVEEHSAVRDLLARIRRESPEVRVENRFGFAGGARWTLWTNRGLTFAPDGSATEIQSAGIDITERKQLEISLRFLAEASKSLSLLNDDSRTLQEVVGLAVPAFADWCCVDMLADDSLERVAAAPRQPAHGKARRRPIDADPACGPIHVARTGRPELLTEVTDEWLHASAPWGTSPAAYDGRPFRSALCVPLAAKGNILGAMTFATSDPGRSYTAADLALAQDLAHRTAIAIENVRLYQAVQEADRRKDEFLAMLAHELRNPLAPIRSGLDLLALEDEQNADVIALMQEQVDHLVRLVDDLLDVSRIMRGRIELRREKVEFSTIVRRSVDAVRSFSRERRQELAVRLPQCAVWLDADPVRVSQVLENLLHNAIKYTDDGGRVSLACETQGRQLVVRVQDTGVGIEPELLPRIFELFTQATRSLDRSQGGLGIGLTLVQRLVELHGGSVSAESGGSGQGSTFTVRLPIAQASDGLLMAAGPACLAERAL